MQSLSHTVIIKIKIIAIIMESRKTEKKKKKKVSLSIATNQRHRASGFTETLTNVSEPLVFSITVFFTTIRKQVQGYYRHKG